MSKLWVKFLSLLKLNSKKRKIYFAIFSFIFLLLSSLLLAFSKNFTNYGMHLNDFVILETNLSMQYGKNDVERINNVGINTKTKKVKDKLEEVVGLMNQQLQHIYAVDNNDNLVTYKNARFSLKKEIINEGEDYFYSKLELYLPIKKSSDEKATNQEIKEHVNFLTNYIFNKSKAYLYASMGGFLNVGLDSGYDFVRTRWDDDLGGIDKFENLKLTSNGINFNFSKNDPRYHYNKLKKLHDQKRAVVYLVTPPNKESFDDEQDYISYFQDLNSYIIKPKKDDKKNDNKKEDNKKDENKTSKSEPRLQFSSEQANDGANTFSIKNKKYFNLIGRVNLITDYGKNDDNNNRLSETRGLDIFELNKFVDKTLLNTSSYHHKKFMLLKMKIMELLNKHKINFNNITNNKYNLIDGSYWHWRKSSDNIVNKYSSNTNLTKLGLSQNKKVFWVVITLFLIVMAIFMIIKYKLMGALVSFFASFSFLALITVFSFFGGIIGFWSFIGFLIFFCFFLSYSTKLCQLIQYKIDQKDGLNTAFDGVLSNMNSLYIKTLFIPFSYALLNFFFLDYLFYQFGFSLLIGSIFFLFFALIVMPMIKLFVKSLNIQNIYIIGPYFQPKLNDYDLKTYASFFVLISVILTIVVSLVFTVFAIKIPSGKHPFWDILYNFSIFNLALNEIKKLFVLVSLWGVISFVYLFVILKNQLWKNILLLQAPFYLLFYSFYSLSVIFNFDGMAWLKSESMISILLFSFVFSIMSQTIKTLNESNLIKNKIDNLNVNYDSTILTSILLILNLIFISQLNIVLAIGVLVSLLSVTFIDEYLLTKMIPVRLSKSQRDFEKRLETQFWNLETVQEAYVEGINSYNK